MTRRTRTFVVAAVAIVALFSLGVSTAMAAWTARAIGSGGAASGAMPTGPAASAAVTANGTDVLVSWDAVQLTGNTPSDYTVKRYGAGSPAAVPASDCDGVVTTNQCTEADVAEGLWTYRIATAKGSWRGNEGVASEAVRMPTRAPSNLTSVPAEATRTSVALTWTDNSAVEDGYLVERSADGSTGWSEVATKDANAQSATDIDLTCGETFSYRVTALSNANQDSVASNIATATAAACPLAPAGPTDLSATPVSQTQINLVWTDNASDETGFKVEVSTDGGSSWSTVTSTVAADTTSYSHTGLTCGTAYHYKVTALGAEVDSNPSNIANTATQQCTAPPAGPSGLSATTVSATRIDLAWTDNATNETHFEIERDGIILGTTAPANTGTGSVAFQDTVACGTQYSYRVRAVNGDGPSDFAAAATVTSQPCAPSDAPATFTATANGTHVDLSWSSVARATSYKVERLISGTWTVIATPAGTTYSHALGCGQTGTYRVSGQNSAGGGPVSAQRDATTQGCAPAAPTGLSASGVGGKRIDLSWSHNSLNATGFRVLVSTTGNAGSFTLLDTVAAGTTTYSHTGLSCNTTRYYQVQATNSTSGLTSASSNTANATTKACSTFFISSLTSDAVNTGGGRGTTWQAKAEIKIQDHSGTGQGALTVTGHWSTAPSTPVACVTSSAGANTGKCTVSSAEDLSRATVSSATFSVTGVTPALNYDALSNVADSVTANRPN